MSATFGPNISDFIDLALHQAFVVHGMALKRVFRDVWLILSDSSPIVVFCCGLQTINGKWEVPPPPIPTMCSISYFRPKIVILGVATVQNSVQSWSEQKICFLSHYMAWDCLLIPVFSMYHKTKKKSGDQTEKFHFLSTSRYGIHQQSQQSQVIFWLNKNNKTKNHFWKSFMHQITEFLESDGKKCLPNFGIFSEI